MRHQERENLMLLYALPLQLFNCYEGSSTTVRVLSKQETWGEAFSIESIIDFSKQN